MTQPLTIYPAIDLKAGQCVRLFQGRMDKATVYNENPASQAAAFEKDGFNWVHIVDLDGAFSGRSENAAAIAAISTQSGIKTQLGGGIRAMAAVEAWFDRGLTRIILGTAAVRDPDFVAEAAKAYPERIVLGLDARDGEVRTDGWAGKTGHTAVDLAKRYEDEGIAAVIYTDIARDGALVGVNVEATARLAEALAIPVIASGGVASVADIGALGAAHDNIEGVVIGRALYDGRVKPAEALAAAKNR